MSKGLPNIQPGMRLTPVGKTGMMSPSKANIVLAVCNAVLNSKVIDTQADEFHITANNASYGIGKGSAAGSLGMHPFKLYATGETSVIGGHVCQGYQVRSGIVEVRPLFHQFGGLWDGSNSQGNYSSPFEPSNADGAIPDANIIVTPATFFLDPTPEIVGGVNYGAYYAFWVRIAPDTDNGGGAYNGSVTIQYHRFSINPGASIYDEYIFPGLPDINGYENLPIAVVQITTETAFGIGLGPGTGDGSIDQYKRDHYTSRFPAGQNGLGGFCFQGSWIMPSPDPSISSTHRAWYPGDIIYFYDGTPGDAINGWYFWGGSPGTTSGTMVSGSFQQIAQFG